MIVHWMSHPGGPAWVSHDSMLLPIFTGCQSLGIVCVRETDIQNQNQITTFPAGWRHLRADQMCRGSVKGLTSESHHACYVILPH